RLSHYNPFELVTLPDVKQGHKLAPDQLMAKEAEMVLGKLQPNDMLVLLDERGQQYSSRQFARQLERWLQRPVRRIVFLVAGAWGAAPELKLRADVQLSLSQMTFSHQMVRLFLAEQLYRAFTILRGEPYHND
ncbi:MAG: 23S rRNA (pseudouridine(1915)-N(3))-methyltransferase RlmH, partial [Bacteroidetes bacterium]